MKKLLSFLFSLTILSMPSVAQLGVTTESFDAKMMEHHETAFDRVAVGNSYEVVSIAVDARMKDQIADVSVTQKILNSTDRDLEIEIFFPLPDGGVVQNFMMMVDGKEVPGELMKKDEAKRIYEGIVRRKRDPALMEYVGYGLFKTSVFPVPVGQEREITVRYTQVCERKLDMINFSYPFGTQKFSSKPLRSVSFHARIECTEPIKNIFSPTNDLKINRIDDQTADIIFEETFNTPSQDFKMTYSLQGGDVGATVLSYKPEDGKEGYFMLLASPAVAEDAISDVAKNIVFVLDRSGSMSGKKIEQSKKAMEFVLSNLNENDNFNIIDYDDRVEVYKQENQSYSPDNLKSALSYVSGIRSGGGTNINDALMKALELLKDESRPNYIMFLTDGLPTSGVTNEMQIAENVTKANTLGARIFAFGVGNDVNARLLDRLTSNNGGTTEYVKPDENIETAVADLYNNISSPVMTDISIRFSDTDVRSTYPHKLPDLFKGSQLVWVGKYNKPGKNTVTVSGKIGGQNRSFRFDVELLSHKDSKSHDYLEKIWASRRVGYLIDQIDLNGRNQEMVDELVRLSKDYGILTPYTAFLAREDVVLTDNTKIIKESEDNLKMLETTSGAQANELREQKKAFSSELVVSDEEEVSYKDEAGIEQKVETIQKLGNKTFYRRDGRWVEGSLSEDDLKNTVEVKKFSDGYFELAKGQSAEFNKYLSFDEDVIVKIDGKVYRILK